MLLWCEHCYVARKTNLVSAHWCLVALGAAVDHIFVFLAFVSTSMSDCRNAFCNGRFKTSAVRSVATLTQAALA